MFAYIILGFLLFSLSSLVWFPLYYKKIIDRADSRILVSVRALQSEGVTPKILREKLISEGYNAGAVDVAILAANLEKQNKYLASVGGILGSVYLLKSPIISLVGPYIFYSCFTVLFAGFVYFLYKNSKNKK